MGAGTGRDPLVTTSLIAGIGFTATAEYDLARTIGAAVPVAVLLPLALDVYVVAAIRRARGRDIALSLVLMGTAQIAAHMLAAHVVAVSVPLVAAVSLLVPLSIWRVHALAVLTPKPARQISTAPVPEAVPDSVEMPVLAELEAARRPELQAVPEPPAETEPAPPSVPVRRTRRVPPRPARSKRDNRSFEEHVSTARDWLADNPSLTGTDIGKKLGTGDSYGRRVRRAALETAS